MTLQNIKSLRKNEKGFTIVELLIVIVIIGILAALVIVAYTGIQNRARATKASTNALAVNKKAEAYAADKNGSYPTVAQLNAATSSDVFKVDSGLVVQSAAPNQLNGETTLQLLNCPSGGGAGVKIFYWDYAKNPQGLTTAPLTAGDTAGVCT